LGSMPLILMLALHSVIGLGTFKLMSLFRTDTHQLNNVELIPVI
jgi:hypothetical protein